jgi:hypothetical protein
LTAQAAAFRYILKNTGYPPEAVNKILAGENPSESERMGDVKVDEPKIEQGKEKRPKMSATAWEEYKARANEMRELYKKGLTDREITTELGINRSTVGKWREREKLKTNFDRHAPRVRELKSPIKALGDTKPVKESTNTLGNTPNDMDRISAVIKLGLKDDTDNVKAAFRLLAAELTEQELTRRLGT